MGDGIIFSGGIIFSDGIIFSERLIFSDRIIFTDRIIFSDRIIFTDRIIFGDRISFTDGIIFSDGTILSNGIIFSDGIFFSDGIILALPSFSATELVLVMALFLDESQRHLAEEACLAEDLLPWMRSRSSARWRCAARWGVRCYLTISVIYEGEIKPEDRQTARTQRRDKFEFPFEHDFI